jgi:hypothetical protein
LNTSAASGPDASAFSVSPLVFTAMSAGDGTTLSIAFIRACMPIILLAEPVSTGTMLPLMIPARSPFASSSSVSSSPPRYFSISASSVSAAASISFSRCAFASSTISDGTSCCSPFSPTYAFIVSRSMTPLSACCEPIGICRGTHFWPQLARTCSSVPLKSAFSRSIRLMNTARGTETSSANCHANSVPTCTPDAPHTTISARSAARRAHFTSPMKSAYPGASTTFTLCPFHSHGTTERLTLNTRFCSSGSQSETVVPSSTRPSRVVAPVANSIPSASEVLPVLP